MAWNVLRHLVEAGKLTARHTGSVHTGSHDRDVEIGHSSCDMNDIGLLAIAEVRVSHRSGRSGRVEFRAANRGVMGRMPAHCNFGSHATRRVRLPNPALNRTRIVVPPFTERLGARRLTQR